MKVGGRWLIAGLLIVIAILVLVAVSFERQNLPLSNQSEKASESTAGQEGEIVQEINMTCGYCQYLVNETCFNYTCCGDSQCNKNESCIKNECIFVNCSSCQYSENHSCMNYECCKDEDCGVNQTCADHKCTNYNYECYKDGDCSVSQLCVEHKCFSRDCPAQSCDDYDHCTIDYCSSASFTPLCEYRDIVPCCGDGRCQMGLGENETTCTSDCNDTSKFLYCEDDLNCVPCCASGVWDGEKVVIVGRSPYGVCVNNDYTCWDVQSLYNPRLCDPTYEASPRECIKCNKCIDNQCVTTVVECTPECLANIRHCGEDFVPAGPENK